MREGLTAVDWTVVGVYLVGTILVGLCATGAQRSVRDYFLGDRSLPWWAVALSLIATETSAATYIGTPGKAYRSGWEFLQMALGFALARLFLARYVLKVYYRAEVVTVYGFLEQRFGEATRVVAALLFLLGRVIGSGVRLYAACLALRAAAGSTGDGATIAAIVVLGLVALSYTFFGGIKSVVWTETILGATFIAGGLVAVVAILARIHSEVPGGWDAAWALPELSEKLAIFHFDGPGEGGWAAWLGSTRPFWIALGGGFVLSLATHGTDQDMVQRLLACPDWRKGGRSLIASALVIVPLNAIFLLVGTLLFVYHRLRPEAAPAGVTNADDHFLLFTARAMPAGVAGFVIAGLVAAAVSSHTSVLNALSSTAIADFYRPHFAKGKSEAHYLRASRGFTLFWGVTLILVAMGFVGSRDNVLDLALGVLTYFYGSLLGVFLLGIFTKRGNGFSATAGMLIAVPLVLLLQYRQFLARPESAPALVRNLIGALPPALNDAAMTWVPGLAWPLWIVVGTAVTLGVGALGRPRQTTERGSVEP